MKNLLKEAIQRIEKRKIDGNHSSVEETFAAYVRNIKKETIGKDGKPIVLCDYFRMVVIRANYDGTSGAYFYPAQKVEKKWMPKEWADNADKNAIEICGKKYIYPKDASFKEKGVIFRAWIDAVIETIKEKGLEIHISE